MRAHSKFAWVRFLRSIARSTAVILFLALASVTAAQAANVTLKVVSARNEPALATPSATCTPSATQICKGTTIVASYKYLITIDNTGTTTQRSPDPGGGCSPQDAGYPANCTWTSIAGIAAGNSQTYTQGTQTDFATALANVPDGRYLISVLAEGYKLDGRHFRVTGSTVTWEGKPAADPAGQVTVELQPMPLPDAQIQAAVFEDFSLMNGTYDPTEHGLAGFQGHIVDYLGEVTTNVYGDPLCGTGVCLSKCYVVNNGVDVGTVNPIDAAGRCPLDATGLTTTIEGTPIPAGAAIEGKLKIPNLGPNRYSLSITPPDGSGWIQTTTLEGSHDWDAWVMEGATGLDTEFIQGGEPFPQPLFGYSPRQGSPSDPGLAASLGGSGSITGVVDAVKSYVPGVGGVGPLPGTGLGCCVGIKFDKPIDKPWVSLADLNNGDTTIWVGQGDANGRFTIPNVPAGTYQITWWDEPQNYALDNINVTVGGGEAVDVGILPMTGWWTVIDGYVFNDTNRNGVMDANEPGLPGYALTLRKRENSLMDRGTTSATSDATGYYRFEGAYPLGQWFVLEAYDDSHYSTGVTYQADNQPTPTTVKGAGVDVSVLPIIGLSGRVDWGKHTYDSTGAGGIDPRNGGIVGTVSYDTTRNEFDPQYAATEDWQPGIPGLTMKLYTPVPATLPCVRLPAPNATCDSTGRYAVLPDGSLAKGPLLNTYVSEAWERPTGCTARDVDGNPLRHGIDEQVLPLSADGECLEGPLMGIQFGPNATDQGTPDANFGVNVNGNFGFGDGCFNGTLDATDPANPVCNGGTFTALTARDYLVEVVIPGDVTGRPIYNVTKEEDVNIGNGDQFFPAVPPPSCAGPLHVVTTTNPTFPTTTGLSPFEGQMKPLCTTKLVALANGKSVVPTFHLFTDVPLPTRFWGLIVDDLNFTSDKKSLLFGEKAGIAFAPVGIYDYTNRLVTTVESDYNGLFDVLLPSTNRISCPTPSGVCANLYRFVGNDPGVPGRLNPNWNPQFRTIASEFEALPGLVVPADLAPTQVGIATEGIFGSLTSLAPVSCKLDDAQPQLYAVSSPYAVRPSGTGTVPITINGKGFGATKGTGRVNLGAAVLNTTSWSDTQIVASIASTTAYGPQQLSITADNGQSTVNGLTFHVVLGGTATTAYNPSIFLVGPGRTYAPADTLPAVANHAIQLALDAAATFIGASTGNSNRGALVVVFPNNPSADPRQNPRGAYYENLIIASKVKLQGVGPGSPDGAVRGSIIDGLAFGGDSPVATDWYTKLGTLTWAGNQTIFDGAVISLYLPSTGLKAFPSSYSAATAPSIDGFDIRGGNQVGFPGNIDPVTGLPNGQPSGLVTQGGAVYANGYARNLQVTNNVVQNNGGAYGTIRIGNPDLPAPNTDNQNRSVVIAYNRVIANAGTNLAGGIGLFAGANDYQVVRNDICGNFSAEYGGGISHYGLSPGGSIHDNRIYYNRSYDEGAGIMIAGQLPTNPATLSPGAGAVSIYNNLIQANLANDDGGGVRFLMAGNFAMNVFNNFIVNNVSTHEGGGIALNDAPNVRFYNNTVMKNLTTATAVTSTGAPAPAGLSTSQNSAQLQATLPSGSPTFSNPLLFNNIFWDNRAGTRAATTVVGIGNPGDATAVDNWDLGVADSTGVLAPTNTVIQQNAIAHPYTTSATNSATDPGVIATYNVAVDFNVWRNNPAFVGAILVAVQLPPNLMGNYRLPACPGSPACNLGAASAGGVNAPLFDIDNQVRPAGGGYDAGADEVSSGATGAQADLSITKTDGATNVFQGNRVTYTIVVRNLGPTAVTGATVVDTLPATLTNVAWVCSATGTGSSCGTGLGSLIGTGNLNQTVNLGTAANASVTYTVTGVLSATATGTLANTATVTAPSGTTDPNLSNNTATDTDQIVIAPALPLPSLTLRDDFNRANANTLNNGTNWSQVVTTNNFLCGVFGLGTAPCASTRVNTNQAYGLIIGTPIWNGAGNVFGNKQGAAVTYANPPVNGVFLDTGVILKASGGSAANPANFIRVTYEPGATNVVNVKTTTSSGLVSTTQGTLPVTFLNGDRLTAVANADGSVDVWKNGTYVGHVVIPTSGNNTGTFITGTGRIGMVMPAGARVDDFSGGTVP